MVHEFDGETLWRRARGRRTSIKTFIMDSRNVVGVGNIYASEALFRAGIRPDSRPVASVACAWQSLSRHP